MQEDVNSMEQWPFRKCAEKKIKKTKELLWRADEDSVKIGDVEVVNQLKKELNELCKQKEKYGNKGSEYSGYKVGNKTLNFSIVYWLNGREETLLRGW